MAHQNSNEVPQVCGEYFAFTDTEVDLRVVFAELGEFAGSEWLGDIKQRVGVTVSWPVAKMLYVDLSMMIKGSESNSVLGPTWEATWHKVADIVRAYECPREFYSNQFSLTETEFGVQVIFGQLLANDAMEPGGIYTDWKPRIAVTLLRPFPEMLCAGLSTVIKGYESLNGEIKTNLMCPFDGAHKVRAPERPM